MKSISILAVLLLSLFGGLFAQAESLNQQTIVIGENVDSTGVSAPVNAHSSYTSYNFGIVRLNSMHRTSFRIYNNSNREIEVLSATVWGMDFNMNHSCYPGLQPNQSCYMDISYWPFNEGYHYGQAQINFTQGERITVDLRGEARR